MSAYPGFPKVTVHDVDADTAEVGVTSTHSNGAVVTLAAFEGGEETLLYLTPSAASHLAGVLLSASLSAVQRMAALRVV